LYGSYLKNLAILPPNELQYIRELSRKKLDSLALFWEAHKLSVTESLFRNAGLLYREGKRSFGFFLFVGLEKRRVTMVETKKGKAFLCDIWFLKGVHSDDSSRAIFTLDEFTTLFTVDDHRV
jgi:urate oxidase